MEPADLARWTRFAMKGGIGKCIALCDCVAENPDDLMFLKDDEIVVLLQIPDADGVYLGYCEGVIGKFLSKDVQFLSKLKKAIMAKRSSTASSAKSPTPPSSRLGNFIKSPTPTGSHVPTPSATPPVAATLTLRSDSRSSMRFSKSPAESPNASTTTIPHSRRSSGSVAKQEAVTAEGLHRRRSGSGSTAIGLGFPPGHPNHQWRQQQTTSMGSVASSGRRIDSFDIVADGNDTSTLASSSTLLDPALDTPMVGSSLSARKERESMNLEKQFDLLQQQTDGLAVQQEEEGRAAFPILEEADVPATTTTTTETTKSAPPPALDLDYPDGDTIPLRINKKSPLLPSTSFNPTSPPTTLDTSLSTIPDSSYSTTFNQRISLASSDGDGVVGIGLSLLQDLASGMDDDSDYDSDMDYREEMASRRSSGGLDGVSDDLRRVSTGTVEVLGYAQSGDEEEQGSQEEVVQTTLKDIPSAIDTTPSRASIAQLSPKRQYSTTSSLSPTSPSFGQLHDAMSGNVIQERERRPSLAPSLAPSATSNSSWEGASDIYDDYRYSRFSMASKMSLSLSTHRMSHGSSGGTIPPPVPDTRTVADQHKRDRVTSDASVYTQASRVSSVFSQREVPPAAASLTSRSSSSSAAPTPDPTGTTRGNPPTNRPAPLNLGLPQTSPILHTTWGSPLSSTGPVSPTSSNMYTPVPGMVPVSIPSNASSGLGVASAMRHRIEEEKKSPMSPTFASKPSPLPSIPPLVEEADQSMTESEIHEAGLGNGIVVEDDEELPSRILEDGDDTFLHDSPRSSRSVSPAVEAHRLGALGMGGLVVSNRTPSPSFTERDSVQSIPILPATPISAAAPPLPPSESELGKSDNHHLSTTSSSPASPPPPSHLRPSLRDLREGGTVQVPGTGERRSIFLPHPNAPKAPPPLTSPGPMYVRDQTQVDANLQHPTQTIPLNAPQSQPPLQPHTNVQHQHQHQPTPPSFHHQFPAPPVWAPRPTASAVIMKALSAPPLRPPVQHPPRAPPPRPRGPTIYGRTEGDLASSMGPVPILWSVEPPPTKSMPPKQTSTGSVSSVPVGGVAGNPAPGTLGAGAGVGRGVPNPSPLRTGSVPPLSGGTGPSKRPSVISLREGVSGGLGGRLSVGEAGGAHSQGEANSTAVQAPNQPQPRPPVGGAIPRANFFPKAAGLRPRSRSFSGFNASTTPAAKQLGRQDEPLLSLKGGPPEIRKSSSLTASTLTSSSSPSSSSLPSSSLSVGTKPVPKSSPLRPSPLSLSVTAANGSPMLRPRISTPILRSPTSPLAQSMTAVPVPPIGANVSASSSGLNNSDGTANGGSGAAATGLAGSGSVQGIGQHMRKLASRSTGEVARPPSVASLNGPSGDRTVVAGGARPAPISRSTLPPPTTTQLAASGMLDIHPSTSPTPSFQSRGLPNGSGNEDSASVRSGSGSETRSQLVTSPTPGMVAGGSNLVGGSSTSSTVVRQNSLRTKLSLPNLRRNRSKQDDAISLDGGNANELLLQVQDMEFELVRPSLSQFSGAARTSEDSGVLGRDAGYGMGPDSGGSSAAGVGGSGTSFLRAESPAVSVSSGNRSPTVEGPSSWNNIGGQAGTAGGHTAPASTSASRNAADIDTSNMEAHRNREQKWMSLLSTSPPAQARKSKKVRKLLLEGVPSSVRYLVWSHLTDGKARCVPGVYAQLCKRGKVPLTGDIEKDVDTGEWFADDNHNQLRLLKEAGGGVVQLLQAYLNMVPDIQYSSGLPHIVGQLLLLAPEEDAFWIFISIMDTHIRPYFSSGTAQMEVDSALFCRALEMNDPAVAKKMLVDMGISPTSICAPWFSALFVGALPPDYLIRTWDLFLYDGIPFLIRVGLAVVSFVRRQILESTSDEAVLSLLHRLPSLSLPPTPDNYISFVLSIKLKDDEIRKQRIKMEAQVKKQSQQQQLTLPRTAGSISLPRT